MGRKNSAKTGGAKILTGKKSTKPTPAPAAESESESEESGNYIGFERKEKDSDDENEQELFNLALGEDDNDDDDDEDDESDDDEEEDDDDDDDEDDDDDDDVQDDDDDDDDDDELPEDMKNLLDSLPPQMRQQILKRGKARRNVDGGDDDDDDDDDDEEEDEGEEGGKDGWGRKKKTYWSGDTADLEIGQDMEDAEEEEAAAQELQQTKLQRLKESDFKDGLDGDSSEDDSSEDDDDDDDDDDHSEEKDRVKAGGKLRNRASKKSGIVADAVMGNLASVSLQRGNDDDDDDEDDNGIAGTGMDEQKESDVRVEKLSKDVSKFTKQQRLEMIEKHSPELLGIVSELKEQALDLRSRIVPIKEFITQISDKFEVQDDVVDYLEVKQQLLLSYCVNIIFYLLMKAKGQSVQHHPVMKQLLKLRYVMEKMRPLDGKLKHQIDRLLQLSELSPTALSQQQHSDLLRPNAAGLLSQFDIGGSRKGKSKEKGKSHRMEDENDDDEDEEDESEDDDEEEEEEEEENITGKSAGVYKVPKRTAVPYKEAETAEVRKEERLEKQRNKLKRSELMDTLREEFGSAPEAAASSGLGMKSGDLLKLQEEEDERLQYEEDRFVRMTMSRKEKKSIKKRTAEASRLDNFDDIGGVGDFEELTRLSSAIEDHSGGGAGGSSSMMMNGAEDGDDDDDDSGGGGGGRLGKSRAGDMQTALQRAMMALSQPQSSHDQNDRGSKIKSKNSRKNIINSNDDDEEEDDPFAAMLAAGPEGDRRKRRRAPNMGEEGGEQDDDEEDDDDHLLEAFGQKKKDYLAKKKAHYTAEPQYGGYEESVGEGDKRAASYEIIKNRGLTPHRKKANRNPRVKKREMFDKAVIRRKGQVRDVITGAAGAYGGEMTGIKSNIARSRKIVN